MARTIASERPITPLLVSRVVSLLLACIFSLVGGALGVNALFKSNRDRNAILKKVPSPILVTISTLDIEIPGALATTVCFLIFVLITIALVLTFIESRSRRSSRSSLVFISIGLTLLCIWLLGSLIAETVYFAGNSARVVAFLNGIQLPENVIKAAQNQAGLTGVYKRIPYLRSTIILQWMAFLFAAIASVVLAIAAVRLHKKKTDYEGHNFSSTKRTRSGSGLSVTTEKVVTQEENNELEGPTLEPNAIPTSAGQAENRPQEDPAQPPMS